MRIIEETLQINTVVKRHKQNKDIPFGLSIQQPKSSTKLYTQTHRPYIQQF